MRQHAIILSLLLLPTFGAATTRPSTVIDSANCVTSDCHVNVKSTATLHGPIANNSCEACHELTSPSKHTYLLRRTGADLCTYCHEFDVTAMPVIHKPVSLGECLGCHDPHGGRDHTLTREMSMQSLCYSCHENAQSDHKVLHTPVAQGQCTSCHPPHAAMFPKLLDAVGGDLCLACHDKLDTSLASVRSRHKALDKGCEQCHDPHGSSELMQLVKSPAELCQGCHEEIKQRIATATYRHSTATSGRACLNCHTPHGSNAVSLLTDQPITLCMGCHKENVTLPTGRIIPAVAELTRSAMHKHGAVNDGECSGCHEAHGTSQPMLLTKAYSTVLYQPFAVEQYALCFSCHDQRLVKSPSAGGLTRFRNGDRNLHWVHIKEGEHGRACAMCHTTHASENEHNIKQVVSLKLWKMPIRYESTDTGGSCSPGCHVPWAYDREQPVDAPASQPTVSPRRRAPDLVTITLNARDTNDRAVRIPSSQPSVIAFARDDASAIMNAIDSAVESVDVNRILVICGAKAIATPRGKWSVIIDPDCKLADQLEVHGWPMVMVVQADGLKVVEFTGTAPSLALKVRPYLDLANGTLDRAAVERVLRHPVIAKDSEPSIPERNLHEAMRLLDAGQPTEAMRLLSEAMKFELNSIPLRTATIRALLDLNRPDDALAILQSLDPTQFPPGMRDVWRARALIEKARWIDARDVLVGVVKEHPNLPEARYLLGTLYERDGQWQRAAEEYRAASQGR